VRWTMLNCNILYLRFFLPWDYTTKCRHVGVYWNRCQKCAIYKEEIVNATSIMERSVIKPGNQHLDIVYSRNQNFEDNQTFLCLSQTTFSNVSLVLLSYLHLKCNNSTIFL